MVNNDLSERIYGMMRSGRSDAYIVRTTRTPEGSVKAYRANFTRQEKMGSSRRSRGLDSDKIQNIVVECLNRDIPREAIYADPRLRGEKAQRIAGFIAAYERGAYN